MPIEAAPIRRRATLAIWRCKIVYWSLFIRQFTNWLLLGMSDEARELESIAEENCKIAVQNDKVLLHEFQTLRDLYVDVGKLQSNLITSSLIQASKSRPTFQNRSPHCSTSFSIRT